MYNTAGTLTTSAGVTTLAATGMNDWLFLPTGLALLLIAIGGVLLMIGSRRSKRSVMREMI